jgi:hypothetical protein
VRISIISSSFLFRRLSFRLSVGLSVCKEQFFSHWTDFHSICYSLSLKYFEKLQFSLKSNKKNEYFTWRCIYIYDNVSHSSSENEKCCRKILWRKSKYNFHLFHPAVNIIIKGWDNQSITALFYYLFIYLVRRLVSAVPPSSGLLKTHTIKQHRAIVHGIPVAR